MRVLVTGAAGFIGFFTSLRLLERGDAVTGLDSVNAYYDPALKEARLAEIARRAADAGAEWRFLRADVTDRGALDACLAAGKFDRVIHLAAQAGVRHSIEHPEDYVAANLVGFAAVIEACRRAGIAHLTYASTSSVYGANAAMPYAEGDGADHPLQLYAATKRANELIAHAYSHIHRLPTTGLRFFTVYGPWGRPDMALFLFAKAILEGRPVELNNRGEHVRDFTYVEDVAEAVVRASDRIAAPDPDWSAEAPDPAASSAPFRIYNVGNSDPVPLVDYVRALEAALGARAPRVLRPLQPGDVRATHADTRRLERDLGFRPSTPVVEGVRRFADWYRSYHGV